MATGRVVAFGTLIAAGIVVLTCVQPASRSTNVNRPGAAQSAGAIPAPEAAPISKLQIAKNLLAAPMSFEANVGQTDGRVKFLSRGTGYNLFLTSSEAVLALSSTNARIIPASQAASGFGSNPRNPLSIGSLDRTSRPPSAEKQEESAREDILRMRLVGANSAAAVTGVDETSAKTNYYIGKDATKWRTNVSNFGKVHYASVYPGVDLVFYGNQRQLEYDFVVAPGADANVITLGFAQANGTTKLSLPLEITADGALIAHLSGGDVSFHKPVIYQNASTGKNTVDGHYVLKADGQVGFALGSYDHSREVVIDPTVSFATYVGGSDEDLAVGVAVDRYTDVVIAGSTRSVDFPLFGQIESYHPGSCGAQACRDVYIAKFNPMGGKLQYSTYIGGSGDDVAGSMVLDSAGDIFVVGYTLSTDFPVSLHAFQKTFGGGSVTGDAFFLELASKPGNQGGGIEYASYLGGSGDDVAYGVTVDFIPNAIPNIYVVGSTTSPNFPTTGGAYQRTCGLTQQGSCSNAFATKVNTKGSMLLYSTFLGGSGGLGDAAYGVTVDSNNDMYIAGMTGSPNFPTTSGAYQTTCGTDNLCNGTYDGFISQLNTNGNALLFSTFLGGSGYDYAAGIALDSSNAIFVSGNTTSSDFPTTASAAQSTFGGMSAGCSPTTGAVCGDVTITKLSPGGASLAYSTYLGGSGDENPGLSLAIDAGGNAYVTGQTSSSNFPAVRPFQPTYGGGSSDAFLTTLNTTGSAFTSSSYFGGNGADFAYRVALDTVGGIYISGGTLSTNLPVKAGAFQSICGTDGNCNGGLMDAWTAKMIPTADVSVSNVGTPNPVKSGNNLTYTITVKNTGPDTALAVSMTDATPAGTTFVSVATTAGGCTTPSVGGTGNVVCTVSSIPSAAHLTVTMVVNVNVPAGNVIQDKVTVASTTFDAKKGNNAATISTTVN